MSRRAWLLFASVALLWGIPYVFIEIALHDLSPAMLAFLRVLVGFVVLLPYACSSGALRGLRSRTRPLLAYTAIELVLAWPLIGLGEQRVSTSQTGTLLAAVPLILAAITWRRRRDQRVSGTQLAGLVIGFAGVLAFVGPASIGSARELWGSLAVLAAAGCYATAPLIIERDLADLDPVGPVTASFGIAACLLAPFALATAPQRMPGAHALVAVAVLGIACSAVAFVAFFALIAEAGPARASLFVYLLPVVATAIGVLFLGERVGPAAGVGLVLILAGSRLASRTPRRRRLPRITIGQTEPVACAYGDHASHDAERDRDRRCVRPARLETSHLRAVRRGAGRG
jgi:drug/metabolite transporter (DMT)-like permease